MSLARRATRVVWQALRHAGAHPRGLLWVLVGFAAAASSATVAVPALRERALGVAALAFGLAVAMGPRDCAVWMNAPLAAAGAHVALHGLRLWPWPALAAPVSALAALAALASALLHALTPLATVGHAEGAGHLVGRLTRDWVRGEQQQRATIWYPACKETTTGGRSAEYLAECGRRLSAMHKVTLNGKVPLVLLSHLERFRAASVPDAPMAPEPERAPVVVFSHGFTGLPEHYTFLMQSLAAHGFVVCGVQHTDGTSMLTLQPDGSEIPLAPLPDGIGWPSHGAFRFRLRNNRTRVDDVRFAIDMLEREDLDPSSPFHGRLDLAERGVCVLGHSFGSATAVLSGWSDERVRAAVALDAWLLPLPARLPESEDAFPTGEHLEVPDAHPPTLFVSSETWQYEENLGRIRRVHEAAGDAGWSLTLKKSTHHTFNDAAVVSPGVMQELGVVGPDPIRAQTAVAELVAAFCRERAFREEMMTEPGLFTVHA